MNVGIDISQVVYEGTGSARYVVNLLRGFAELKSDAKLDLTLFGSAYKKRKLLDNYATLGKQTKFYPFPPKFFELLWNKLHVVSFEEFAGKVEIYHSSDWTQGPSKAKKVTTVHDLIPFLFPEYVHPRIRAAHEARWKWIQQEVDCVIVDAECTKRDILKLFKMKEEQIKVIPLGVERRFLDVGQAKIEGNPQMNLEKQRILLSNYNLKNEAYILSVGTLEPRKNVARLVRAYSLLAPEIRAEFPLIIVGKKAWAEQIAIPADCDVRFTGYVSEADLPQLFGSARLFVMPSLYEGFGLPVLEAMASGTPVLAAKTSSLPEIGRESIMYFSEVENEVMMMQDMERAISDYPNPIVEQSYHRAEELSWELTAKKTLEVYTQLNRT